MVFVNVNYSTNVFVKFYIIDIVIELRDSGLDIYVIVSSLLTSKLVSASLFLSLEIFAIDLGDSGLEGDGNKQAVVPLHGRLHLLHLPIENVMMLLIMMMMVIMKRMMMENSSPRISRSSLC